MKEKIREYALFPGRLAVFGIARALEHKMAAPALSMVIVGGPAVVIVGELLDWLV